MAGENTAYISFNAKGKSPLTIQYKSSPVSANGSPSLKREKDACWVIGSSYSAALQVEGVSKSLQHLYII